MPIQTLRRMLLAALAVSLLAAAPLQAKMFIFKPLPAQQAVRLGNEAQASYEVALAAIDKNNHEKALAALNESIRAEPENPWLRYAAIQVAIYLGDTRNGRNSLEFYDNALEHLKVLASSESLNIRERERAEENLKLVTQLRALVAERDAKRRQFGMEIAKQYAKVTYKDAEREAEEKKEREEQMKQIMGGGGATAQQAQSAVATEETRTDSFDVMDLYKRARRPSAPAGGLIGTPAGEFGSSSSGISGGSTGQPVNSGGAASISAGATGPSDSISSNPQASSVAADVGAGPVNEQTPGSASTGAVPAERPN